MKEIILENDAFRLAVGEDGIVRSLTLKENGEECLAAEEEVALFSVTQERPFNNEVKLAHPNKRTAFQANEIRREGNLLRVRFETVPVRATIEVVEAPAYIAFRLAGFTVLPEDYGDLCMKLPPVAELRLCQLPVRRRENFGEWLNVVWDERAAVALLAASPCERIDQEARRSCRVLTADAVRDIRLEGSAAALFAATPGKLLDAIGAFERDFGLPDGVSSRRSEYINRSVYWTSDLCPDNVDEHIAYARQGGFRLMLVYYTAMFFERGGYAYNGNYDYNERYPNGRTDLVRVLEKVKSAGIVPGLHFLQTHIGLKSRYVTPHADHRLGKKRMFTLARPLEEGDGELYVEENPQGCVTHPKGRVLQFGGELIGYEDYVAERPYRFTGIVRGALGTEREKHPLGQIGGLLNISEYGGTSCYIAQDSTLQDEIAEKLADAYNAGFQFCYMDGSEGTDAPYEYHVPNAQYRVYRLFRETPLFTEGAAKAHFSWHFQSGGNAFDIFPPKLFKEKIVEFPAREAPCMRMDFTRLDFGWWGFWAPREEDNGTQTDMYEYGTAIAAAWNCPVTIQIRLGELKKHPRLGDILEVMRRWEDVRARALLTDAQREELKDYSREHTLLIDENGEYELVPWRRIAAPENVSAFAFERGGARYAAYWHERAEGELELPLPAGQFALYARLGGEELPARSGTGGTVIPAGDKLYLKTALSMEELESAFSNAKLL